MSRKCYKYALISLYLCIGLGRIAFSASSGTIQGTLTLDDSWQQNIYLSLVESFEKEFAVSDEMIIGSSPIDSLGRFSISLSNLPLEWCMLRLHVVKKGNPAASLVIGGLDENYTFMIANPYSKIALRNTLEKPIFKNVFISGAPYQKTIDAIKNLANYPDALHYQDSMIEKEFIEEVVSEKLKLIADTCENLLVALYALYQTDFHADYRENPGYYHDFLSKWKKNNSPYFQAFSRQFPLSRKPNWPYLLIGSLIVIVISTAFLLRKRKQRSIKKLSVQERRIFAMLQKGASNQEISDEYNIALSTVKSHVSNIFSKLNIKSRKEAIDLKIK